jgi:hypothetical protein
MKLFSKRRNLLFLVMTIITSCNKSSNSNNSTCNVSTGDLSPLTSNKQVAYGIEVTNGATVSSVTYQDSAGNTTVNNPILPFVKNVNLKSGQTVSITATGTPNGGEITVASTGNSPNTASCP